MDPSRFDGLVRSLGTSASRRRALLGLLAGLTGAGVSSIDGEAKAGHGRHHGGNARDRKRRREERAKNDNRGKAQSRTDRGSVKAQSACYPGTTCTVGPGKNLSKCDLADSAALKGKNCKGCNLSKVNLRGADARNADLTNANLGKTCLVETNFRGATLAGVNFEDAIFCRTIMPNGTVRNDGCASATTCCPTCIAIDEACGTGIGGSCCNNGTCQNGLCAPCVPACTGKQGGPDGCGVGGTCGACPGGSTCDETSGQCSCVPDCTNVECGSDGCGGTCGTCPTALPEWLLPALRCLPNLHVHHHAGSDQR